MLTELGVKHQQILALCVQSFSIIDISTNYQAVASTRIGVHTGFSKERSFDFAHPGLSAQAIVHAIIPRLIFQPLCGVKNPGFAWVALALLIPSLGWRTKPVILQGLML